MPGACQTADVMPSQSYQKFNSHLRVVFIAEKKTMNIQDIRLELVKQAIDKGVPPGAIPGLVDPLAEFVVSGLKSKETHDLKDFEQKYMNELLKKLQQVFGEQKISAVEIGRNGALRIWVSCQHITDGIKEFFSDSRNYPDFFRGRELVFFHVPPKKP